MTKRKKYLVGLAVYLAVVLLYILVSRSPGYFSSKKTMGKVKYIYEKSYSRGAGSRDNYRNPVVEYMVQGTTYSLYRENMWYTHDFKTGDIVSVIYNPGDPADANIYLFISYWISMTEIFVSCLLFLPVVAYIEGQYS